MFNFFSLHRSLFTSFALVCFSGFHGILMIDSVSHPELEIGLLAAVCVNSEIE